jgi:hypothetical protein
VQSIVLLLTFDLICFRLQKTASYVLAS